MVRSRGGNIRRSREYMGMSRGGNIRRIRGIQGDEQGMKNQENQRKAW